MKPVLAAVGSATVAVLSQSSCIERPSLVVYNNTEYAEQGYSVVTCTCSLLNEQQRALKLTLVDFLECHVHVYYYMYRKSGNFHVQNILCLKISYQNIFVVAGRPQKFPTVFMFLYVGIRTYVLARAMACDCSEVDRDPFGSGKPSLGPTLWGVVATYEYH